MLEFLKYMKKGNSIAIYDIKLFNFYLVIHQLSNINRAKQVKIIKTFVQLKIIKQYIYIQITKYIQTKYKRLISCLLDMCVSYKKIYQITKFMQPQPQVILKCKFHSQITSVNIPKNACQIQLQCLKCLRQQQKMNRQRLIPSFGNILNELKNDKLQKIQNGIGQKIRELLDNKKQKVIYDIKQYFKLKRRQYKKNVQQYDRILKILKNGEYDKQLSQNEIINNLNELRQDNIEISKYINTLINKKYQNQINYKLNPKYMSYLLQCKAIYRQKLQISTKNHKLAINHLKYRTKFIFNHYKNKIFHNQSQLITKIQQTQIIISKVYQFQALQHIQIFPSTILSLKISQQLYSIRHMIMQKIQHLNIYGLHIEIQSKLHQQLFPFKLPNNIHYLSFKFNSTDISQDNLKLLAKNIIHNCFFIEILEFQLYNNKIDQDKIIIIASILKNLNLSKIKLDFRYNNISLSGIKLILNSFQKLHKSLKSAYLMFDDNKITDEGILELSNVVYTLKQLNQLKLGIAGNNISNKYLNKLINAIKSKNMIFLSLDISSNSKINSQCLIQIQKMIQQLKLEVLELKVNFLNLTKQDILGFIQNIKDNMHLNYIYLQCLSLLIDRQNFINLNKQLSRIEKQYNKIIKIGNKYK